jgi:ectoine hydroxylase-related dioxygenase (phytanoyl-CoA dioxygenase family)
MVRERAMNRYGIGEGKPGNNTVGYVATTQLKDIQKTLPLRVLSPEDWAHWTTWGYVVVKNAVPQENVRRMVDLLWEFQEMDRNDPATWNKPQLRNNEMTEINNAGMVEIYNHQELWNNRQLPRVYNAFVDIWDQEDLWVTIDRANLNTPNRNARSFDGFLHWDVDTRLDPLPVSVQGVVSLVDSDPEIGGFQCVPELFRTLENWRKTQPADRNGFSPGNHGFELVNVQMQAGDLLIFNSLLAHGIRPNRSENRVRMAQYISMTPAAENDQAMRDWRVMSWHDRKPPEGYAFPGDPRNWEKTRYERAQLTPLGEKLLGLRSWKEQSAAAE